MDEKEFEQTPSEDLDALVAKFIELVDELGIDPLIPPEEVEELQRAYSVVFKRVRNGSDPTTT